MRVRRAIVELTANDRVEQPRSALNLFVAPLASLTEIAVVRAAFPGVLDPTHQTAIGFDVERAADVAVTANRFRGVELPGMESEVAISQSPDWTDGDTHAARGAVSLGEILAVGRGDRRLE